MKGSFRSKILVTVVLFIFITAAGLIFTVNAEIEEISDSESIANSQGRLENLTDSETVWLKEHPVITVAIDPDWPPVEFDDKKGEPSGMSMDYLELIEKKLDVEFRLIKNLSWMEAYKKMQRYEIDMTTSVSETPQRKEFWAFTEPYMNIPLVIATQSDVTYISELEELAGKKVALVDGYAIMDWLPKDYPGIEVVPVKNAFEGLEMLQRGEVFAYIDNLLIIGYYQAKMQVNTIKIAGQTKYTNSQCMAVRKDWAPFAGILQKALEAIPQSQRNEIYRKWIPVRYEHGFNYKLFWQVFTLFAVIVLFLFYRNRMLKREINNRKKVEEDLVLAMKKAESADKLKSEFLAQMSHEIRTPINIILNSTSLIKEEIDGTEQEIKELFPVIDSAGKRLIKTIDSILNMSELQLGIYEPQFKKYDLVKDIMEILYNDFRLIALKKGLEFFLLPETKDTGLVVDNYSTSQIFSNLIDNAIKYTKSGKITIRIYRDPENSLSVDVIDTGIGISETFLPSVFNAFSQEEQGYSRQYEGNGLGLALIKKYCDINGAKVSVRSEKNSGSVFTVCFPGNYN